METEFIANYEAAAAAPGKGRKMFVNPFTGKRMMVGGKEADALYNAFIMYRHVKEDESGEEQKEEEPGAAMIARLAAEIAFNSSATH